MKIRINGPKSFEGDLDDFEKKFFQLPHEFTEAQCLEIIQSWCKFLDYTCEVIS